MFFQGFTERREVYRPQIKESASMQHDAMKMRNEERKKAREAGEKGVSGGRKEGRKGRKKREG